MIIKKFEEQVERHFNSTALKKAGRIVTYGQLNANADRIAHAITSITSMPGQSEQVALLFEHGIDMVIAIIATLKANKTYVPLDVHYPHKRLLYILENSQTSLILTNQQNEPLAHELTQLSTAKLAVLNIETINEDAPSSTPQRDVSPDKIAYIIYTSGSTGNPKGVYQTHQNVWYYTRNWVNRFGITANDRMSLFTALTHDGAVQDIFSALLTGAALYPYSLKENGNLDELYLLLLREKITIWHSVPSLFRFFANGLSERDLFYDIRWVLLGGEPLREHDLQLFNAY